jgi:glycosyltransferase involved in cell wall biosynthesis
MHDNKSICLVIPAHNEESKIAITLDQIPHYIDNIVLVNDGSIDNTLKIMKQFKSRNPNKITIIDNAHASGVGGAMKKGLLKARELKADIIVKMDGDNQMDPSQIFKIISPICSNDADIVKGTRFSKDGKKLKMPLIRVIGTFILTLLMRLSTGYWHLTDPQNGFIGVSNEVLNSIDFNKLKSCFAFENSLLIQCSRKKFRMSEVGVSIKYDGEVSHLKISTFIRNTAPFLLISFIKRIFYNLTMNFPSISSIGYLIVIYGIFRQLMAVFTFNLSIQYKTILISNNPVELYLLIAVAYFSIWIDKMETVVMNLLNKY